MNVFWHWQLFLIKEKLIDGILKNLLGDDEKKKKMAIWANQKFDFWTLDLSFRYKIVSKISRIV